MDATVKFAFRNLSRCVPSLVFDFCKTVEHTFRDSKVVQSFSSGAAWSPLTLMDGSEVLLPPLLRVHGVQDGLPLRTVSLVQFFNLLLHHGVQGFQPHL